MDLVLGDVAFEGAQAEVAAVVVEAADRHHRVAAGRELDARGVLRARGGRHPAVGRRIALEGPDKCAAGLAAAGLRAGGAGGRVTRPARARDEPPGASAGSAAPEPPPNRATPEPPPNRATPEPPPNRATPEPPPNRAAPEPVPPTAPAPGPPRNRATPEPVPPGAPPPAPPPMLCASAGPADGIEPVCAVLIVCAAYAAGPARQAITPRTSGDRADAPRAARRATGAASRPSTAEPAATSDHGAQPRLPGRRPREQRVRPAGGARDGERREHARGEGVAVRPQQRASDRDERGDRRRERDRVVGVDHALAEAEHDRGDEQPAAPQQQRRARAVGARRAPARPQPERASASSAAGQQPGGLAAHQVVEQAQHARSTPLKLPPPPPPPGPPLAKIRSEAVVAGDQVEDAVVGRAVDERPRARRPERDDRDPPAGARGSAPRRRASSCQIRRRRPRRRGDQVDERERRQHEERLQHLRQEGEPDQRPGRRGSSGCRPARARGSGSRRSRPAAGPAARRGC